MTKSKAIGFHTVGLGTFAPAAYSQKELIDSFGYQDDKFVQDICRNGHIEERTFCEHPAAFVASHRTTERSRYFRRYAPKMGFEALTRACDGVVPLDRLGAVIVTNSSGFVLPGLSEIMGVEYGVGAKDALRFNMSGQGCYAAVPAIELAKALITSGKVETAAVIATEPTSAIFKSDAKDRSERVVHLLFGEGAAATVFARDSLGDHSHLPSFGDSETLLGEDTLDYVTIELADGWVSKVGPKVPEGGAELLPRVVSKLLSRNGLAREDIEHWVFHTGGRRVLDGCQAVLGLTSAQMEINFDVLRRYGNMQSCTVLFSLQECIRKRSPRSSRGLLVGIGPGMTVAATLLEWA